MSYLSKQQVDQLLWPIKGERVTVRRDDKKSHVEAYEIRAHLIRVFGFCMWDGEVLVMDQLFEQVVEKTNDKGEKRWVVSVGYRAHYRLTIRTPEGDLLATYTEWAAGDAVNFPTSKRGDAHDFAMKTAESQALKRCATNLGDQFGLSLYNKGSVAPLVGGTHHYPFSKPDASDESEQEESRDVSAHITTQIAPEVDQPDERESARVTQQPNNGRRPPPIPAGTTDDAIAESYAPAGASRAAEVNPDAFPDNALRTRILDAKDPRELLGIKTEVVRAGTQKQITANRDGVAVTIGALIDAEIQTKSRKAAPA